jgi:hypothetical protein
MEPKYGFWHLYYQVDRVLPKEKQEEIVRLKQNELIVEVLKNVPDEMPVVITKNKTVFFPADASMMYAPGDTYLLSIELREYK